MPFVGNIESLYDSAINQNQIETFIVIDHIHGEVDKHAGVSPSLLYLCEVADATPIFFTKRSNIPGQ